MVRNTGRYCESRSVLGFVALAEILCIHELDFRLLFEKAIYPSFKMFGIIPPRVTAITTASPETENVKAALGRICYKMTLRRLRGLLNSAIAAKGEIIRPMVYRRRADGIRKSPRRNAMNSDHKLQSLAHQMHHFSTMASPAFPQRTFRAGIFRAKCTEAINNVASE